MSIERLSVFWGKYNNTNNNAVTKPLWHHLVDVKNCSSVLWHYLLSKSAKQQLSDVFLDDLNSTNSFLSFICSIHDIGKLTPVFQFKIENSNTDNIRNLGFIRPSHLPSDVSHALLSGVIVSDFFELYIPGKKSWHQYISAVIASHHGTIYSTNNIKKTSGSAALGGSNWKRCQSELINELYYYYRPEFPQDVDISELNKTLPILQGLLSTADWIASDDMFLANTDSTADLEIYDGLSRELAGKAIHRFGFNLNKSITNTNFSELFNGLCKLRPLQKIVEECNTALPSLTIIEAPTGEGKTEAALYLAARQQNAQSGAGICVAMPTQATSNSLFERFAAFVKNAGNDSGAPSNLRLIHGNDDFNELRQELVEMFIKYSSAKDYSSQEEDTGIVMAEWFLPKKRSLLAPFSVSTVDQVFLSILNTRHYFMRLFGLAGKTVVFDEVHAYDSLQKRELTSLISWLAAIGSNVIILSATLPTEMRKDILKAWNNQSECKSENYPLITQCVTGKEDLFEKTFDARRANEVDINLIHSSDEQCKTDEGICEEMLGLANRGAKVAYIVNSVRRSQEIYSMLTSKIDTENIDVVLFHSGFMLSDRMRIEKRVLSDFGIPKESNPQTQKGIILISTQIVEQSLDIDFDAMFTDLAPIDLLVQRAGRLHRHDTRVRPECCEKPILNIILPSKSKSENLEWDNLSFVYDTYVTSRTYFALLDKSKWVFPDMYRELIESVYGEGIQMSSNPNITMNHLSILETYKKEKDETELGARNKAASSLIQSPDIYEETFDIKKFSLLEDDDAHITIRAQTRLGEPSVRAVVIFENGNEFYIDRDCTMPLDLSVNKKELYRQFIYNSTSISMKKYFQLIDTICEEKTPAEKEIIKRLPNGYKLLIAGRNLVYKGYYEILYDNTIGLTIRKG